MSNTEAQLGIIRLLAEHEERVAELYQAYADKLPERAEFWSQLAAEEMSHAHWIRGLEAEVEGRGLTLDPKRFTTEALKNSMNYLAELLEEAETKPVTLLRALSVGADLENALIEKRFFDVCAADGAELRAVLGRLQQSTAEHRARLQQAVEEARGTGR